MNHNFCLTFAMNVLYSPFKQSARGPQVSGHFQVGQGQCLPWWWCWCRVGCPSWVLRHKPHNSGPLLGPHFAVCAPRPSPPYRNWFLVNLCQCRIKPKTDTRWPDMRAVRLHPESPVERAQPFTGRCMPSPLPALGLSHSLPFCPCQSWLIG